MTGPTLQQDPPLLQQLVLPLLAHVLGQLAPQLLLRYLHLSLDRHRVVPEESLGVVQADKLIARVELCEANDERPCWRVVLGRRVVVLDDRTREGEPEEVGRGVKGEVGVLGVDLNLVGLRGGTRDGTG